MTQAEQFVKDTNQQFPEYGGNMSYQDCIYTVTMDYAKKHPDEAVIVGFGYNPAFCTGEEAKTGLQKFRLDELGENGPAIILYAYHCHELTANTKAMEMCNLTPYTPVPAGGDIMKDVNGEYLGAFRETAMCLIDIPVPVEAQMASLKSFQQYYNSLGIVNVHNVSGNGFFPCPIEGAAEMEKNGELTIRLRCSSSISDSRLEDDIKRAIEQNMMYQTEMFAVNTAKFFVDGYMYTIDDWVDIPDYHGSICWRDEETFKKAVADLHFNDIQCHFHIFGDRSSRLTMDAIEEANIKYPNNNLRHSLAHIMFMRDEDKHRMGKYNCVAAMQPFWFMRFPDDYPTPYRMMVGDKINTEMYPYKSLDDAGATIACGSDFPISLTTNPIAAIQYGCTREAPKGYSDVDSLLMPEERVSLDKMIEAVTINVAKENMAEDITGSLEVGKFADFVVLDQDLFKIDLYDIRNTNLLYTYLKGNVIYDASQADYSA